MKFSRTRNALLAVVLSLALACGGSTFIKSFRVALASSGPLVQSLVNAGSITQPKADAIRTDFDDGAICAQRLQNAFSVIAKDDPNARSQKLSASVNAMRCWRVVVARQNFTAHPRINQAADLADGILSSLVIFYSDSGEMRASVEGSATVQASDEKEIEKKLNAQVEKLKKALRP